MPPRGRKNKTATRRGRGPRVAGGRGRVGGGVCHPRALRWDLSQLAPADDACLARRRKRGWVGERATSGRGKEAGGGREAPPTGRARKGGDRIRRGPEKMRRESGGARRGQATVERVGEEGRGRRLRTLPLSAGSTPPRRRPQVARPATDSGGRGVTVAVGAGEFEPPYPPAPPGSAGIPSRPNGDESGGEQTAPTQGHSMRTSVAAPAGGW